MPFPGDEIIRLNIGGEYFVTTRDTLTQRHYRSSSSSNSNSQTDTMPISVPVSEYFCSLLSNHHTPSPPPPPPSSSPVLNEETAAEDDNEVEEEEEEELQQQQQRFTSGEALFATARDESGALFIDRSPQLFGIILEYLRTGELHIPHHVMAAQTIRSPQMAYYHHHHHHHSSSVNINNSGSSSGSSSSGGGGNSGMGSSASSSSSSSSSIVARMQNLSFGGAVGQQLSSVGIGGGLSRSSSFRTAGIGGGGSGSGGDGHERQDSLQSMVDVAAGHVTSSISPREYSAGKHGSGANSSASASIPALSVLHQLPDSNVFLDQANHMYNMFILRLLREADFYMIDLSSQLFNIVGDGIFVTNDKENKCLLFFDKDPLNRPASLFMNGIFMNEFVVDKEVCIRNGVIEVHQNDPRCETPQIVYLLYPSETMVDINSGSGYRQSSPLLFGRKRLSSFESGRFASMVTDVEGMEDENTLQEGDTSAFIDDTDVEDNNNNSSSSRKNSGRKISKKRRPVNTSSLFEYLLHKVHPKSQGSGKDSSSNLRDDDSIPSGMNTRNLRTGLIFSDARTTSTSGHSVSLQVKDLRNFRQSISLFPAASPSNMQLLLDRVYVDLEDFNHNIMFQRIDERHMRVVETTLRNPSACGNNRPGSQNLGQSLTVLDFDAMPDNDARTRILGTSVKHRNRLSLSGDKIILETVHAIMDTNFLAKAKDNFIYIESRNRCYWIRNGCLLIFELANKKL